MENRRQYRRLDLDLLVRFRARRVSSEEVKQLQRKMKNLSLGGVFIDMIVPFQTDTRIEISFKLPESEIEVEAKGLVVRAIEGEGMGIKFHEISTEDRDALQAYLDSHE